jgi:hypothetical protein
MGLPASAMLGLSRARMFSYGHRRFGDVTNPNEFCVWAGSLRMMREIDG